MSPMTAIFMLPLYGLRWRRSIRTGRESASVQGLGLHYAAVVSKEALIESDTVAPEPLIHGYVLSCPVSRRNTARSPGRAAPDRDLRRNHIHAAGHGPCVARQCRRSTG